MKDWKITSSNALKELKRKINIEDVNRIDYSDDKNKRLINFFNIEYQEFKNSGRLILVYTNATQKEVTDFTKEILKNVKKYDNDMYFEIDPNKLPRKIRDNFEIFKMHYNKGNVFEFQSIEEYLKSEGYVLDNSNNYWQIYVKVD